MQTAAVKSQGVELDDYVLAFEVAWSRGEPVDLKEFLPEPGHSLYGSVLRELVRVDLEYRWDQGRRRPLEEYRDSFPELFRDPESLHAITFEEYRLRREAGERPAPAEYQRRFGVDVRDWPFLSDAPTGANPSGLASPPSWSEEMDSRLGWASMMDAALAYRAWCRGQSGLDGEAVLPPGKVSRGARSIPSSSTSCTDRTSSSPDDWPGP